MDHSAKWYCKAVVYLDTMTEKQRLNTCVQLKCDLPHVINAILQKLRERMLILL
jgi:hypothetical protein